MATWSVPGGGVVRLSLTSADVGQKSRSHTFTAADGIEASTLHTVYLTIDPDEPLVQAFVKAGSGTPAIATVTGPHVLIARGDSDAGSNLTVTFGVLTPEGAPGGGGSWDTEDYATLADIITDGWTLVSNMIGSSTNTVAIDTVIFDSGVRSVHFHINHAAYNAGNISYQKAIPGFTPGAAYTLSARIRVVNRPWFENIILNAGGTSGLGAYPAAGAWGLMTASGHLASDGIAVVKFGMNAGSGVSENWDTWFDGVLTLTVAGGASVIVDFSTLDFCVGSGTGDGGTGTGDGGGGGGVDPGPGTDPPPDPGTDPTPAAPGDRAWGTFNTPVGIWNVWNLVPKHFDVHNTVNLINQARAAGSKLCFFSYGEPDWRDGTRTWRYYLWKAKWDLLIGDPVVKAAIDDAIADGVIIFHYVIDEPFNRNPLRYGGPLAIGDVELMCGDSKAAFPTLPTAVALAPYTMRWWMTRRIEHLDWLFKDYTLIHPDPILWRDQNIDRARELGHIFAPGIHYSGFDRPYDGNPYYISPAQLRHYGKIMTDPRTGETENFAPFFLGWRFVQAMYDQPGFKDADRYCRDNFRSNY